MAQSIDPFTWDGSYLGELKSTQILQKIRSGDMTWWLIESNAICMWILVRTISSALPCLIDELKPIFRQPKVGTHHLRYAGRLYIVTRPISLLQTIKSLDPDKLSVIFVKQVQETFVFRDILAITCTHEQQIRVYAKDSRQYPISFMESGMKPDVEASVISPTVREKWFKKQSVQDALLRMLNLTRDNIEVKSGSHNERLTEVLFNIRNRVEKAIMRIDKENIWMGSFISQRMMDIIQNPSY